MERVQKLNSSSSETAAVNLEIRRHFEYMEEMKRNVARREREKRKPKRPLSAYNLFFKSEREKLVQERRRVGFSDMAKEISTKWKALDTNDRTPFEEEALNEKRRYKVALSNWKAQGKLDSRKAISYHGQHIMSLGNHVPTLTTLVGQNKPDQIFLPSYLFSQQRAVEDKQMNLPQFHLPGPRRLVEQRVVEEQQMNRPLFQEFQGAALFAGPRRMSMPSFTTSTVGGSEDSCKSATLPMSLQGIMEHHFSAIAKTATFHQGGKLSSVPPLPSFESDNFDPDNFLEPIAFGDSGDDDASFDPEIANAFISMPFSDIESSDDDSDESYDAAISHILEPLPMRHASLPCLPNYKQTFGEVQNRRSFSMPISRAAEMNELQGIMHMLEREIATGAESNFLASYDEC